MTQTIITQGGFKRLATAIGGAAAALSMTAFAAVMVPAAAHADPTLLQYSTDQSTWGGMDKIPNLGGGLVPGSESTSKFWAKNGTNQGGTLQVYLGNYTIDAGMQAYVRAEINDASGDVVDVTNNMATAGTELKAAHLAPGQTAKVMLVVGMPKDAGNDSQDKSVNPNFSLDFELDTAGAPTTTTVTGAGTATTGVPVTLTATVAPAAATGTVQFKDGAINLGTPAAVINGIATLSQAFSTAGAHSVTAVYSGDTANATSTSVAFPVTVTDPAAGATTTVVTGPATTNTSAGVQLTATVTPAGATGLVQFKDGTTNLGQPVALTNGVAKLTQIFTAGAHSITAVYAGDATHATSTSAVHTVTATAGTGGGNGSMDTGSLTSIFGS
ncbi:Ig-like domain repeat protein [Rhodococcus spelaei]|uniref:Ig-like domain repeat protein n=1 Tax=Rhodococcus spelaei TaxID=2546320 RepID=A0A541B9T2_9NOCA|nr:Ig-like domain-containing protein [Rhodococcus spelaei]TQF69069.1 Ig-like domain repeat protein [Rhodococcus spelaei]